MVKLPSKPSEQWCLCNVTEGLILPQLLSSHQVSIHHPLLVLTEPKGFRPVPLQPVSKHRKLFHPNIKLPDTGATPYIYRRSDSNGRLSGLVTNTKALWLNLRCDCCTLLSAAPVWPVPQHWTVSVLLARVFGPKQRHCSTMPVLFSHCPRRACKTWVVSQTQKTLPVSWVVPFSRWPVHPQSVLHFAACRPGSSPRRKAASECRLRAQFGNATVRAPTHSMAPSPAKSSGV